MARTPTRKETARRWTPVGQSPGHAREVEDGGDTWARGVSEREGGSRLSAKQREKGSGLRAVGPSEMNRATVGSWAAGAAGPCREGEKEAGHSG